MLSFNYSLHNKFVSLPVLLVLIFFFLALITKVKKFYTVIDTDVFFVKKLAETYRTLNCQYRNRTNWFHKRKLLWIQRFHVNSQIWLPFYNIICYALTHVTLPRTLRRLYRILHHRWQLVQRVYVFLKQRSIHYHKIILTHYNIMHDVCLLENSKIIK